MKMLIVATHPDDEVIGCGGTAARHAVAGDEVHVLVVTRGDPEKYPAGQVEELRRELAAAHKVMGVRDVQYLDYPAPKLDTVPRCALADAIDGVLQSLKPDMLFLPHRGDLHADHRAVHQAALVAARPNGRHRIGRLLSYETLSETEWGSPVSADAFLPTVFVNIADFLEPKLRALECYRSQLKDFPHPRSLQAVEALARLRGSTAGYPAAEAFMLVRETV
jgi:LmbE family N-acetylglucosaminyl deacetylase